MCDGYQRHEANVKKEEVDALWLKSKQDIYCFADLVSDQETDKLSKWWRKLVADIVESIHKDYENKPVFRLRRNSKT